MHLFLLNSVGYSSTVTYSYSEAEAIMPSALRGRHGRNKSRITNFPAGGGSVHSNDRLEGTAGVTVGPLGIVLLEPSLMRH